MRIVAGLLLLALEQQPPSAAEVKALQAELVPGRLEAYAARVAPCNAPWSRDFLSLEDRSIRATGRARRSGDDLFVGKARFRDDHSGTDGRFGVRETPGTYEYIGVYAKSGLDLVHVQYHEGDGYILVDPASGDKVEFAQPTVPSPSGRYFAAASDAEAYNFNGVQIAERTSSGLKMAAELEQAPNPCGLVWRSDSEIALTVKPLTFSPRREWSRASVVRGRDGRWIYRGSAGKAG